MGLGMVIFLLLIPNYLLLVGHGTSTSRRWWANQNRGRGNIPYDVELMWMSCSYQIEEPRAHSMVIHAPPLWIMLTTKPWTVSTYFEHVVQSLWNTCVFSCPFLGNTTNHLTYRCPIKISNRIRLIYLKDPPTLSHTWRTWKECDL